VNAIQFLSSQPWVERLGWTLVHFLWQGVLIAALYAAARSWIANSSRPNTRYILACVALGAMMVAPLVTWSLMRPSDAVRVSTHLTARVPFTASTAAAAPVTLRGTVSSAPSMQFLPWVVAIWLAGAIALWIRLIGGWIAAARIRSTLVRPAPPEWQRTLSRLQARVGVTRPVRLLISALVQAPAVVGWLRPVVLVPIGALAGLPSEQVEALLIHELAHIRRHDYLVNILQSVAEALLFYHPAVWWVSGHIRTERELCCDDVAVSLTGDALTYALALAEIESSRPAHLNAAVAANGGSLTDRIARLLGQSRPASRTLPGPAVSVTAILLVVAAYGLSGQSADAPRFDVASIKLHTSGVTRHGVQALPGGLHAENSSVRLLMQNAYAAQAFQIVGGPGWVDSAGYDVEAKAVGNPSRSQIWLMLQSLLEDRFQLKVHRETKELPVYALIAAKSGLKLRMPQEGACVSLTPDASASDWAGGRLPPPGEVRTPLARCGSVNVVLLPSGARMQGGKIAMPEFIRILSMALGSPVVDKTGFTELFDVRLDFLPDETTAALPAPPSPPDNPSPSILAALQEQLGLKLESTKGPVEVLVIDRVGRPTEN
jgi:uncharacterized protein (TIGR03435 family)